MIIVVFTFIYISYFIWMEEKGFSCNITSVDINLKGKYTHEKHLKRFRT